MRPRQQLSLWCCAVYQMDRSVTSQGDFWGLSHTGALTELEQQGLPLETQRDNNISEQIYSQ